MSFGQLAQILHNGVAEQEVERVVRAGKRVGGRAPIGFRVVDQNAAISNGNATTLATTKPMMIKRFIASFQASI